jgi:hypothetical protein
MYPKADIYGLISVGAAIATTPNSFISTKPKNSG